MPPRGLSDRDQRQLIEVELAQRLVAHALCLLTTGRPRLLEQALRMEPRNADFQCHF